MNETEDPRSVMMRVMRESGYDPEARPAIDLGTNATADKPENDFQPEPVDDVPVKRPAPVAVHVSRSSEDIFREFVELAKADPMYLNRLAAVFSYQSPFKRSEAVKPMPVKNVTTIECAIDDAGAPTSKRVRWDKCALRFSTKIQACTSADRRVSAPAWVGRADFREPKRAGYDADRLHRQKTFTDEYREFIRDVERIATESDMLIGFLRAETDGQGTPHVQNQLILAKRAELEAHQLSGAVLMMRDEKGVLAISLPRFDTKTSKGKALGSGFKMQSRGIRSIDEDKRGWCTGELEIARM